MIRIDRFGEHTIGVTGYDPEKHLEKMDLILSECVELRCFHHGGQLYAGMPMYWAKVFLSEESGLSFADWLLNKGCLLGEIGSNTKLL